MELGVTPRMSVCGLCKTPLTEQQQIKVAERVAVVRPNHLTVLIEDSPPFLKEYVEKLETAVATYGGLEEPQLAEIARARRSDPSTSHAAAKSVRDLRDSQRHVLDLLRDVGPVTDEELVLKYTAAAKVGTVPRQSESGIRTRRRELCDAGLVEDTGERRAMTTGRQAIVWRVRDRSGTVVARGLATV